MNRRIAWLLGFCFALTSGGTCGEQPLSLDALIAHAIAARDDLRADAEAVAAAEAEVSEAFSHYLPRLRMRAGLMRERDPLSLDLRDTEIETAVSTSGGLLSTLLPGRTPATIHGLGEIELRDRSYGEATLTVEQPLFTWGRISSAVRAARKKQDVTRARLRCSRVAAAAQVRTAYYAYQVALEMHTFAESALLDIQLIQEILEETDAPKAPAPAAEEPDPAGPPAEDGSAPNELDRLDIDALHLQAKTLVLQAEALRLKARRYLSLAAGFDEPLLPERIAAAPLDSLDLEALAHYENRAIACNPTLAMLRHGIEATESLKQSERAAQLPAVGLVGYMQQRGDDLDVLPDSLYGGGVVMEWDFPVGRQAAKVKRLGHDAQALRDRQCAKRKQVRTAVASLHETVTRLRTMVSLAAQETEAQHRRVKLARFGFTSRLTPFSEYRDAMLHWVLAKRRRFELLLEMYETWAELLRVAGDAPAAAPDSPPNEGPCSLCPDEF